MTGTVSVSTRRSEFLAGAKVTTPMIVGSIPFAMIFGAVSITSGLSPAVALAMSCFVYAGSAQLVGAGLVGAGAALPIIFLTTLVINLRLVFYAALTGTYFKHLPQRWLALLAFGLTDHTFVVSVKRLERDDDSPYKHWYYFGSAAFMYVNWQVCRMIGIIAGQSIGNPRELGLDFAAPATFTAMLVPMLTRRPMLAAALVSGMMAIVAHGLPNQLGLLVATFFGMVAGLMTQNLRGTPNMPVVAASEAK